MSDQKRILIFGDSQAAGSPGASTEAALKASGYAVQRFGNVGKGASDYARMADLWSQYTAAVRNFRPDAVLAIFGSNDVANAALEAGMKKIRDGVAPPVFYSGPPAYPDPTANARGQAIRDMAKGVWGDARYIDPSAWTGGSEGRAADGLHFTASGGARWGQPLAAEFVRRIQGLPSPLSGGHPRAGSGGGRRDAGPGRPSGGSVVAQPSKKAPSEPKK